MEQEILGGNNEVVTPATDVNAETTENNDGGLVSENENVEKNIVEKPADEEKSFTQEQVNAMIKERLDRANRNFYKRYNVEDKNGLDVLINKALSYDEMDDRYNTMLRENRDLHEKLTIIENNIIPEKADDVKAYFKGKELEFNNENLVEALKTHPEWVKKSNNIVNLGSETKGAKSSSEREFASKIFGVDL